MAVDGDFFRITHPELGVHTVTARLEDAAGSVVWTMTVVYGPQEDNEKLQFLGNLGGCTMG